MGYWGDKPEIFAAVPAATNNLVAEFLHDHGLEIMAWPERKQKVRRVAMSVEEISGSPVPATATLVICPESALETLPPDFGGIVCAVFDTVDTVDGGDSATTRHRPRPPQVGRGSFAVIDDGRGVDAIARDSCDCLLAIGGFCASMALAVSARGLCQSLVNIAEQFFGRFIAITDSSNILLGYSRHILPEDEVSRSLVRLKYHAQRMLRQQTDHAISETITRQEGVEVFPPDGKTFNQALLTYPVRINDQFAAYIVMTCDPEEITPALMDAFELFVFYCERLCERRMGLDTRKNMAEQNLLFHLIVDQGLGGVFIREQAEALGIPVKGHFTIAKAYWDDATEARLADFAEDLCQAEIPCIALPHDGGTVVLLYCSGESELMQAVRKMLGTYPVKKAARVSLGDEYRNLTETYFAHRSLEAIDVYRSMIEARYPEQDENDFPHIDTFRDVFSLYWSDPYADDTIRDFSAQHMVASHMADDDKRDGTDNVGFIATYLACERRITEVSRICHLHRNGVQYRLKKIQSTYYLDFNRFLTRQYVQASLDVFYLLKGHRQIGTLPYPKHDGYGSESRPPLP